MSVVTLTPISSPLLHERAEAALDHEVRTTIEADPSMKMIKLYHAIPEVAVRAQRLDAMATSFSRKGFLRTTDQITDLNDEIRAPFSWDHLAGIAANPIAPGTILAEIALLALFSSNKTAVDAMMLVLRHRNLPDFVLDYATSMDLMPVITASAARNPSLSVNHQRRLLGNFSRWTLENLSDNPHVDHEIRSIAAAKAAARTMGCRLAS